MKKTISIIIAVILAVCAVAASVPVYAESAPSIKHVLNGDAELGDTTGWTTYSDLNSGMAIENIVDPDDPHNRVIKFTPATSGGLVDWSIPMFDIGAAVFQDEDNGYFGGGAGDYKISVKVKTSVAGTQYARLSLRTGAWNWSISTYNRIGFDSNHWIRLNNGTNDPKATLSCDETTRWNTVTKTFTVTQEFINVKKDEFRGGNASAYVLNISFDNPNIVYYLDDASVVSAPRNTMIKQVQNGDAELGTTDGWSSLFGAGTVTNETIDGSRVIHFVPDTANAYSSVQFDITSAVVNAPEQGYNGHGDGIYKMTFRIKRDNNGTGANGYFNFSFLATTASQWNAGAAGGTQTQITSEWKTITVQASLNGAFTAKNPIPYVGIRVDGSGNRSYGASVNDYCGYYIDDVKLYFENEQIYPAVAEGPAEPTVYEAVNSDAELGNTTGWKTLTGSIENTEIDNNSVIKVTPPPSGSYQISGMFNIGAAVFNDEENGYFGKGAGNYTVSVKLKTDATSAIYAHMTLVSGSRENTSANSESSNGIIGYESNTWVILQPTAGTSTGSNSSIYTITYDRVGEWYTITRTFSVADDFLSAQGLKELYLAFDNITVPYYLDDVTVTFDGEKLVPKPKAKTLINADAENGNTAGWGVFSGGTVANFTESGNHYIKYTPTDNTYGSVAYDLGPAIINDSENKTEDWYTGGGAGCYLISFKMKVDSEYDGKYFNMSLRSNDWNSGTADYIGETRNIQVRNTWQTYYACVNVTDTWLNTLKENKAKGAYGLYLRLDGSGGNYAYGSAGKTFPYYVDDFSVTKIKFTGANVSLGNSFSLSYYVPAEVYNCVKSHCYATFKLNGVESDKVYGKLTEDGAEFTFTDISPKYINDDVTAEFYVEYTDTNNNPATVCVCAKSFSIAQYCDYQINNSDDLLLKNLCIDLLNYGAAAQEYEGHKREDLANASLNDVFKAYGSTKTFPTLENITDTKHKKITTPAYTWKSAQLILNNSISCYFSFKPNATPNVDPAKVIVTVGGSKTTISKLTKNADDTYTFRYDGMLVDKMREPIYAVVCDASDNEISYTLQYSVESYVFKMQNADPKLAKLVKMLIKYGDSAKIYSEKGKDYEAQRWVSEEMTFVSKQNYAANAQADVILDAVFTNEKTETTLTIPAFWDGGNDFKVRFAPTQTGTWNYKLVCDTDSTLDGIFGTVNVSEYSGDLDVYEHGFVRTETDKKYFVYDDGTPFFYLGDTHWAMLKEEYDAPGNYAADTGATSHFKYIVDKRVEQDFTVYQSQVNTDNLNGYFNLRDGFSETDITGFKKADKYFEYIAEKGLTHAHTMLFFTFYLNDALAQDEAYLEKISRYWVARYGAYPVMWTLAQECDDGVAMSTGKSSFGVSDTWTAETNPWIKIAKYVHKYDAYAHPLSGHQATGTAVTAVGDRQQSVFYNNPNALDAETGHSWWAVQWAAHNINNDMDPTVPQNYYTSEKPAVLFEGKYEYLPTGTTERGARAQGWNAFLNGMCGYGYGIQGIWNYDNPYQEDAKYSDGEFTSEPGEGNIANHPWGISVNDSCAAQLGYMKEFLENIEWWKLVPSLGDNSIYDPAKISGDSNYSMSNYSAASVGSDIFVVYLFDTQTRVTGKIKGLDSNSAYTAKWFDPRTGAYTAIGTISGVSTYKVSDKPTANDWILLITKNT